MCKVPIFKVVETLKNILYVTKATWEIFIFCFTWEIFCFDRNFFDLLNKIVFCVKIFKMSIYGFIFGQETSKINYFCDSGYLSRFENLQIYCIRHLNAKMNAILSFIFICSPLLVIFRPNCVSIL